MINISIIRDGKNVYERNVTKQQIIKTTSIVSLLLLFVLVSGGNISDNILNETTVKAIKWQ